MRLFSQSKKFLLTMLLFLFVFGLGACKKPVDYAAQLEASLEKIEIGYALGDDKNNVNSSINLPDYIDDLQITWTSNNKAVLNEYGNYTGGEIDTVVVLTASISKQGVTKTKDFSLVVKPGVFEYEYTRKLPSTELLPQATDIKVIEDAPELLIIGAVLDTYLYFLDEAMSGYEYIKVFNNTNAEYNMKNHRIVLCNPIQAGQNIEDPECLIGNKSFATGYLFYSLIDVDFKIPALSTALIWLKPYYWMAGSGTGAFTKPFTPELVHVNRGDGLSAFEQTIEDFKEFWDMEGSSIPVYEATNMAIAGIRSESGTDGMFPLISPAAGTPYTHLNSTLTRGIEIGKFDDQEGTASIELLNKYSELTPEKQIDPDPVYGKQIFNVIQIKQNGTPIDGYLHTNTWKYFEPIIRINFCGRINIETLTAGQTSVSFKATSGDGIGGWDNTIEMQFRPPKVGERIMQWQLPIGEYSKYVTYLDSLDASVMRFVSEQLTTYRYVDKTILLSVNPALGNINWRRDELKSPGRMSCACPTEIKAINLTRPGV